MSASRRSGFAVLRTVGLLLVVGGTLLVAGVGWRYLEGTRQRSAARERWNQIVTQPAQVVDSATGERNAVPGDPVARVLVPRLEIDEVVLEGVSATELNAAPGHHPGTPLPGDYGNSIISAHRDRHFFPLGQAVVGDTVITETADGRQRWRIVGRRIATADSAFVLSSDTPLLTLTTCWPIRHIGPAPDRLLLTAEPIDAAAASLERLELERGR